MLSRQEPNSDKVAGAVARLVILLGLFIWMFRPELSRIISSVGKSSEWVHALAAPIMIALLAYHRRAALARRMSRGSLWGAVVLIAGLFVYAATTWPFRYGYFRDIAMILVLAGIVLVACGWGALRLSLPMLLLVLLAIPLGDRIYARLIIRPETYTIQAVATALGRLPGVDTVIKGVDIFFESNLGRGVVALGQSNRGVRLLPAFAVVGVFVVFLQIRSIRRLVIVACAAIPIILFCNFFRFLCWGLLQVYIITDPASAMPRNVSMILSLFLSYVLFVLVSSVRVNLFVDVDEDIRPQGAAYA
jgi:exosortase